MESPTVGLVTSIDNMVTTMDEDSARFAEMILAKARFHRIIVESLERGQKKEEKMRKEKKRSPKSPKKKSKKKSRESIKKDKDKKEKKKKDRDEKRREKVIEKLKKKGYEEDEKNIEKALKKVEKQARKIKRQKEKERKKKKKKPKSLSKIPKSPKKKKRESTSSKKTKKRDSKRDSKSSKALTVDVSENDSGDENFNYWWSIGNQEHKSTPTQIVNKIPHSKKKKKKTKRDSKTCIDVTDHSATESATETTITERTSRCSLASSQQWSFSSPIVRKLTEESTEETQVVMWWDKVQDAPPKTPTSLPSRTPTTTPTTAQRRSFIPMLLSPRSDTSDSDYDDVSIFSEESLSEQILDDLSCILDCSDDDIDYPETPKPRKDSSRSLSNKSYDSSSICSGPFSIISPLRKKTSFKEVYDGTALVTPPSERHLSSVRILGSRPSPHYSPGSNGSKSSHGSDNSETDTRCNRRSSQTSTPQTGTPTEDATSPEEVDIQIELTPKAGCSSKSLLSTPLDGITPVSTKSLFGNRKVQVTPRVPTLPTSVPLT
mmetsp:Transcript_5409/g.12838  ORF Transcript_5409/g.12838 Transcript_5409/m.12838 type:complete len:546 (+) Transcript_5409:51-1688(+)